MAQTYKITNGGTQPLRLAHGGVVEPGGEVTLSLQVWAQSARWAPQMPGVKVEEIDDGDDQGLPADSSSGGETPQEVRADDSDPEEDSEDDGDGDKRPRSKRARH